MRERLRSMRSRESGQSGVGQSGSKEAQDQRDRSARARRTDSGTGRRVVFEDRLRSPLPPPVRSRQQLQQQEKEEELAAMRRQVERLASKVTQLEIGKKWKHKGNEKQFQFAAEVRGIMVEDL